MTTIVQAEAGSGRGGSLAAADRPALGSLLLLKRTILMNEWNGRCCSVNTQARTHGQRRTTELTFLICSFFFVKCPHRRTICACSASANPNSGAMSCTVCYAIPIYIDPTKHQPIVFIYLNHPDQRIGRADASIIEETPPCVNRPRCFFPLSDVDPTDGALRRVPHRAHVLWRFGYNTLCFKQ